MRRAVLLASSPPSLPHSLSGLLLPTVCERLHVPLANLSVSHERVRSSSAAFQSLSYSFHWRSRDLRRLPGFQRSPHSVPCLAYPLPFLPSSFRFPGTFRTTYWCILMATFSSIICTVIHVSCTVQSFCRWIVLFYVALMVVHITRLIQSICHFLSLLPLHSNPRTLASLQAPFLPSVGEWWLHPHAPLAPSFMFCARPSFIHHPRRIRLFFRMIALVMPISFQWK